MKNQSKLPGSMSLIVAVVILVTGCGNKTDGYESAGESVAEANPYASIAGDWMAEIYMPGDTEPAMVTLLKANDTESGWTMKMTHLDEPVAATNVFMKGDSVVVEYGSYPSGLREGHTVEGVTTYMHVSGDKMSGRFAAVYDDGVTSGGSVEADRVK